MDRASRDEEVASREWSWHPSPVSLRRESRRLRRAFGTLVLAVGPAAAIAQACNSELPKMLTTPPEKDGATDGSSASDADVVTDAALDRNFPGIDAACLTVVEVIDAGPDALPDADIGCRYTMPCGLPDSSGFVIDGCGFYLVKPDPGIDANLGCWIPEGNGCMADVYTPSPSGVVTFQCWDCIGGGGRKPAGLLRPRAPRLRAGRGRRDDMLGAYFARMAHDEAASIHAFDRMRDELARLGAPCELAGAAACAARDEARHARLMGDQARAFGSEVPTPRVRRTARRTLASIARENAVEGCIRETYGAILMHWQAMHAQEPALRALFARIAVDETRHAALSWQVAEWAEAQLDPRARARVHAARARALLSLRRTLAEPGAQALDPRLGRPDAAQAVALLDGLMAVFPQAAVRQSARVSSATSTPRVRASGKPTAAASADGALALASS